MACLLPAGLCCLVGVASAGPDWKPTNGPSGGFVYSLATDATDPTTTYAVVGEGVYVSHDAGASWFRQGPKPFALGQTRVIAANGALIGWSNLASVVRSTDGGATWQDISGLLPASKASAGVASQAGNFFLVFEPIGSAEVLLFRSSDTGASWTQLTGLSPANTGVQMISTDGVNLYAPRFFDSGFFKSNNEGQTWTLIQPTGTPPGAFSFDPFIVPGITNPILGVFGGFLHRSFSGGQSWLQAGAGLTAEPSRYIASNGVVLARTTSQTFRSLDSGQNFALASSGLPTGTAGFGLELAAPAGAFLVGLAEGVYRSSDQGASWAGSNAGLLASTIDAMTSHDGTLLAISRNVAKVYRTDDLGWTWTGTPGGFGNPLAMLSLHASSLPSGAVFVGTSNKGIHRSFDGGITFSPVNTGVPIYNGTAGNQLREIQAFATHNGQVFAGTGLGTEFFNGGFQVSGGGMLRSLDGGQTWQSINTGYPIIAFNQFNNPVFDPVQSAVDEGSTVLVGGMRKGVQRWNAGTGSWQASNGGLPINSSGDRPTMFGFARDATAVYAAGNGFFFGGAGGTGVFKSTDGGFNWSAASQGLTPNAGVLSILVHNGRLVAATEDGVFESLDAAQSWQRLGESLVGDETLALALAEGVLFASPRGASVWRLQEDVTLCYADCDVSGGLTIDDFICFQTLYATGNMEADCDQSGGLDIDDFICFQTLFAIGC